MATLEYQQDQLVEITDQDIRALRKKIEDEEHKKCYQALLRDYENISYQSALRAQNTHMNIGDNEERLTLHNHDSTQSPIFQKMLDRFIYMMSPSPVIGSLVGLSLILTVYIIMHSGIATDINGYNISKFSKYYSYFSLVFGGFLIISSSQRSLLLPVCSFAICVLALAITPKAGQFLTVDYAVFQVCIYITASAVLFGALAIDRPKY